MTSKNEKNYLESTPITKNSIELVYQRKTKITDAVKFSNWRKLLSLSLGMLALLAILASGIFSQYYKNKTMPNVYVAGIESGAISKNELTKLIEKHKKNLSITLHLKDKELKPKSEELGVFIDVQKTVKDVMLAKRNNGLITKISFWSRKNVPASMTVNSTLLNQYLEVNAPSLNKPWQDAQLKYNTDTQEFIISKQADGKGPNAKKLESDLSNLSNDLSNKVITIGTTRKQPAITENELSPILVDANRLLKRTIILKGQSFSYKASPADIASWMTPTPQKNGTVQLIVDPGKVQSYIDVVAEKVSNPPIDKKVLTDETTKSEMVLQEGKNGTELTDKKVLANAIAKSLSESADITQSMNIKTANFTVINMNTYDKWIEVDLSEQRTTAYEKSKPVKNFLIASGLAGHETVTGEFSIWLRVRKQTMQGGSKADGSYYNTPNVEWVSYFYKDYALHGAWWREKFGAPASHGCVNMTNSDAKWVYQWAPLGTKVIVHA